MHSVARVSALRHIKSPPRLLHNCAAAAVARSVAVKSAAGPLSAYIHLPFCKRKCFYCDFPVEAVGLDVNKTRTQDRMQAYIDLVCSEIRATARLSEKPLQTVCFGGGTPSLVPPHLLELLLTTLQQQYGIAADAEISMEADPGTFCIQRLQQYKMLGVTRVSVGVQCFQEDLLQACGRSHSLSDVYSAIEAVRAAKLDSWSLDLISGLPNLAVDSWKHSLQEAVAAEPNHISVYDLQVEDGTPFARWYAHAAASPLPLEPEAAAMYELASQTLRAAGYEHYEISNYARPGHRSKHNQVYWKCQQYYAFGLGAASYTHGRRFTRPRSMSAYRKWVKQYLQSGSGCPAAKVAQESKEDRLLECIMLRLRTADGLRLHELQQQFGNGVVSALMPIIRKHTEVGLMQVYECPEHLQSLQPHTRNGLDLSGCQGLTYGVQHLLQQGQQCSVRLTDPAGFLVSNDIIADIFAGLDRAKVLLA